MTTHVTTQFRRSVEDIDPSYPLHAFGIHSLAAIEMRNWVWNEMKSDGNYLSFCPACRSKILLKTLPGEASFFVSPNAIGD
jgi:zearalenone synthase (highly reducing iterative type I polyketide synthase)